MKKLFFITSIFVFLSCACASKKIRVTNCKPYYVNVMREFNIEDIVFDCEEVE